jgi:hypothetical protein
MQAPTHILAGVLIQKACSCRRHNRLALGPTALVAFLSHGFLDRLANLTYHRANPDFHSPIWVGYHATLLLVTILFLYWWWKPFRWGIVFACLPDLDWIFIHGQELLRFQIAFYREPLLHNLLGYVFDHLPGFGWLRHLPNYRSNPWAIVPEAVVITVLAFALRARRRPSPNPGVEEKPKSVEAVN